MREPAQLFVTCIIDTFYPHIGASVVRVLKKAGVNIEFPTDQTCCGQPAFNAGMRSQALPIAKHTIQVFEKTRGPIVVPSGSCTGMIRHGYQELFANETKWLRRVKDIADRTYEFTEFLVDYLKVVDFGAKFYEKVTYHSSCHLLRDLGIDRQPRELLKNVKGMEFVELTESDECCGFGGVFSVEHPELSAAMLERKIENIEASQATKIVSCDAGCMTSINGGLHRLRNLKRVLHIAEVLDSW